MIVKAPIAKAVIACALFAEARFSYTGSVPNAASSPALAAPRPAPDDASSRNVRSLGGLLPFVRPYRARIAAAALFLVLAAVSTLIFPVALKSLIDQGFIATDPGAMTRLLDRLEAKGFCRRERSTDDRRVVRVELTPEGEVAAQEVPIVLAQVLNEHLAGFSKTEWAQLKDMLRRMVSNGEAAETGKSE